MHDNYCLIALVSADKSRLRHLNSTDLRIVHCIFGQLHAFAFEVNSDLNFSLKY